jgi:hypothetical protein
MKRPIGLILTTIVLGLIATFDLFTAAITLVGAAMGSHFLPATTPGSSAPPVAAKFLLYFDIGFSLFLALLATWVILTIVGLLRLRNWGRISVLIIGGCLTVLGGLATLGFVLLLIFQFQSTSTNPPGLPPNLPPHFTTFVLAFVAFSYACFAAVGVWWLIYFNRTSVKAFFVRPAIDIYGHVIDSLYTPPPSSMPSRFANVPVAIVILACFFFLSTLSCAMMAFMPFPAFLFGFVLTGPAKLILYLTFAVLSGFIGYGLLRLDNRARIATLAFLSFGLVNMTSILLPWGRSQFLLYNQQMMHTFQLPGEPTSLQPDHAYAFLIVGGVGVLIFNGFLFWLLQRNRSAFLQTPRSPAIS